MPNRKTAEEILAVNDVKRDEMVVEEWDTVVTVQGLTKRQQLDIRTQATIAGEIDEDRSQMLLWMEGVVDPKFTEDQLGPLFEKNAGAIDRVIYRILELSGMREEAIKAKEARFPVGARSTVPVQLGSFPAQNSGGVAVGSTGSDQ